MTLSNTTSSITVAGDGLTSTFDFDFPLGGSANYAVLVLTTIGGGTASVASTEFSLTGVDDPDGGTFTYPLVGSPISSGEYLTLYRTVPLVNNATIANQGNFAPTIVDGALDYETMALQQLQRQIDTINATLTAGTTLSGVTNIATGTGLFGGPITGTGTISITASGITSGLIAAGAVISSSITASAVTTSHILDAAVTFAKFQNISASSLFGNPTTASTTGSLITLGPGLAFTGTTVKSTQLLFSQTASITVSNTTSETTLVGGGTGSVTLTASYLTVGKTLKLFAQGYHSATSSPTLNMKFLLGTTTVSATGNVTLSTTSNSYWEAMANVVCTTTGSSGAVNAQGKFVEAGATPFGMANTTSVAINTTTSMAVNLTAQWSTASTTDSIVCTNLTVEAESV